MRSPEQESAGACRKDGTAFSVFGCIQPRLLFERRCIMSLFKPSYKDRKTGKKKKVAKWWVEVRDHQGIVRRFPAFTDKRQAGKFEEKLKALIEKRENCESLGELAEWVESLPIETRERLVSTGLLDKRRFIAAKSLQAHIEDFEASLKAKGNTNRHVQTTISRIKQIIAGCGFKSWSDVSAHRVERYLAELRRSENGISKATSNHYLQAIQQFGNWLVDNERATTSPLRILKKLRVLQTDRKRVRRALEPDEVRKLLEVTGRSPVRFGMTGQERRLLYKLAIETGLRAGELRSLTVSSFDFKNCTVAVIDAYSKNRKESLLPLRKETAVELESFFKGKLPGVKAFGGTYQELTQRTADVLKLDLADAGINYVENGFFFDFHAHRHETGTLLAASGTNPAVAQSVLRHSNISLTMNVYTHALIGQEAEAVAKLPDLSQPKHIQKATGTTDL